jgi:hypothetical protein
MSGSLADFKAKLNRFSLHVNERAVETTKQMARVLLRRIVRRTPFRSGQARINWKLSLGAPDLSIVEVGDGSYTRDSATAAALSTLSRLEAFTGREVIYLANGLPYIGKLERGSSKERPQGMVGLTLAELETRRGLVEEGGSE